MRCAHSARRVSGTHGDFVFFEQAGNEAVPRIFLRPRLDFRDREKFRLGQLGADGVGGEGQHLGLSRVAPERQSLHEPSRAVAPVGVIQAHGIARVGELLDAHAALQARAKCPRCGTLG